jgi:hypothetical protein
MKVERFTLRPLYSWVTTTWKATGLSATRELSFDPTGKRTLTVVSLTKVVKKQVEGEGKLGRS